MAIQNPAIPNNKGVYDVVTDTYHESSGGYVYDDNVKRLKDYIDHIFIHPLIGKQYMDWIKQQVNLSLPAIAIRMEYRPDIASMIINRMLAAKFKEYIEYPKPNPRSNQEQDKK